MAKLTKAQLKKTLTALYTQLKGTHVCVNWDEVPAYKDLCPHWLLEEAGDMFFPEKIPTNVFPFLRTSKIELEASEIDDPSDVIETTRVRCSDVFRYMEEEIKKRASAASLSDVWILWDNYNDPHLCTFSPTTTKDLKSMVMELMEIADSAEKRRRNSVANLTQQLKEKLGTNGAVAALKELLDE